MSLGVQARSTARSRDDFVSTDSVLEFVAQQLHSLMRWSEVAERPSTAFITVPAPRAPLHTLLGHDAHTALWDPPEGERYIGVGRALEIHGTGPGRVVEIRERAQAIWPTIARATYPGLEPMAPRFFGGFAFSPGAADHAPWSDFGDGRFVLPALLYALQPAPSRDEDGPGARLALCTPLPAAHELGSGDLLDSWVSEQVAGLASVLQRLGRAGSGLGSDVHPDVVGGAAVQGRFPPTLVTSDELTDEARWRRQIQDIRDAIADQRCDKIVAARCRVLELAQAIDHGQVLDALDQRYPDCHRFAFRFGGRAIFVGATPERLIACAGERISTQALAGSIAAVADADPEEAALALLASQKDRSEQDFVVQAIRSALEPLCAQLDVPDAPVIRELRDVLHLETPIAGRLHQPVHILHLLALLHPTPAVGGVPTDVAVSWIEDNEPAPRGWYAAPVGHFDSRGHGEFAVAIRSGLLDERRAHIYVGAGIVHDSDADKELAETQLKQSALLGALGIRT